MPQIGQSPGLSDLTDGCIGQVKERIFRPLAAVSAANERCGASHIVLPPRTAAKAIIKIVFVFIISVVFVFQFRLPPFVRRRVISDSSRAQNSVERTKATVSGSRHTTGFWRNESDEPGAIPRVKRRAIRH